MNTAALKLSSMPCIISSGRGNPRTSRASSGSLSMRTLWPFPCESQTTISAGPVSRIAAIAALTSPVIHSRARWYSKPSGPSCAGWTTPVMPSMSTEMKIFRGRVWAWPASVRRIRAIETRCIRGHIVPRSTSAISIDRSSRFEYNRGPMRHTQKQTTRSLALATAVCAAMLGGTPAAQNPDGTRVRATPAGPVEPPHHRSAEVGWRLAPPEQKYAAIDGAHLKTYVSELTAISRRYRDNGHPQYWGRIIGTSADNENAEWLMHRFRRIGLTHAN